MDIEKYTTKMTIYRTEKVYQFFDKPIYKGRSPSLEAIEKSIQSRKSEFRTEESQDRALGRARKKIHDVSIMSDWEYFVTLTFDPNKVDSFDYEIVTSKLSKWLNNLKGRKYPNMKYVIVPELHKSGRWHFHGLFIGIDEQDMKSSGKKDNKGREIYNWQSYSLGFTTATKIGNVEHTVKYLTKYITKEMQSVTKNKKVFWSSRNLEMPKVSEMDIDRNTQEELRLLEIEKMTSAKVIEFGSNTYTNRVKICRYKLE